MIARRMRVLLDLDGMGYDVEQRWLDRINEDWGTTVTKADVRDYDVAKAFEGQVPKDEVYRYLHEPAMFCLGAAIPGFTDAVAAFREAGDEVLILSAPSGPLSAKEKLEWCAAVVPSIPLRDVMLGARKSIVRGDVLLDDQRKTLLEYKRDNPAALCAGIAYPYNASTEPGPYFAPDYTDTRRAWATLVALVAEHRAALQNGGRP